MGYQGGYYVLGEPLVRGEGPNGHTANDMSGLSDVAVQAVNLIQDTPWAVNKFILSTIKQLQARGSNLTYEKSGRTETVLFLDKPINPKNDPFEPAMKRLDPQVWEHLPKDEKKAFVARRARCLKRYEENLSSYRATLKIIDAATEMAEFERFYFPHNFDFRLRIYPIPSDLSPQSNDLSKGLLRFSRGTRVGAAGLHWMGSTLAAHWGWDKLGHDERNLKVREIGFHADMNLWVEDPVRNQGWLKADSPFQFLALAQEWLAAWALPDPEGFISHLPGNLDGSCNGAQHLSILSRDPVGAKATNCCTSDEREDLYMEVADRVWAVVEKDAQAGHQVALEWVPKLMNPSDRRTVVKRSVMTVPYGVTNYGVADFMIKDGHVDDTMEQKWDSARYVRDLIMSSIDETLNNGRALQRWFQACATLVAQAGKPLIWETPAGSRVTQAYYNLIAKRVRTLNTRFVLFEEPLKDEDRGEYLERVGLNVSKMGTSAPPNVVHSCDAAHLQITTVRMAQAGIRDFSMIHDSFGCPFAYVGVMRDILRETIVEMYQGNYLMAWKESVERHSGVKLPDPPELGEFDINEVLTSEYFFS